MTISPASNSGVVRGAAFAVVPSYGAPLSEAEAAAAVAGASLVADLFKDLDDVSDRLPGAEVRQEHQDHLAEVRLGVAASLYAALRCKHQPTAAHALRVALGCSMWGVARGFAPEQLDQLEVAALLHDIGKVGVPDELLMKPRSLSADEARLMDKHRRMGLYILLSCCESLEVMHIVGNSPAWFDGSRSGYDLQGAQLPIGARMLSIVDAFDAMTSDHVYRPALPRERALSELIECSGRQFDPELVQEYAALQLSDLTRLQQKVAKRWLVQLDQEAANRFWGFSPQPWPQDAEPQMLFQQKLLDTMHDAVVFIDTRMQITLWNRGAERLTGMSRDAATGQPWSAEFIKLREENGRPVRDVDCPVMNAIRFGRQAHRRMVVGGREDSEVTVNAHAVPVVGPNNTIFGATLVLHDASPEESLEAQMQQLHEQATKDPLTQVANRAAFDHSHPEFVAGHLAANGQYSLIIMDIDHFKRINDGYGHQAGDEALQKFSALLREMCRPGDLVARYGGEEFVVLCPNCDSATAAKRADEIRMRLSATTMTMLGGHSITASFGVTELQPGDTPETMLRRADRALLSAKDQGRNRVIQLGGATSKPQRKGFFQRWFGADCVSAVAGRDLVTPVPLKVAIEKLRGFVADHNAEIVKVQENDLTLRVGGGRPFLRRTAEGGWSLLFELSFEEELIERRKNDNTTGNQIQTRIRVTVRPKRNRDTKRAEVRQAAEQLITSLRSYLMGYDAAPDEEGVLRRTTNLVAGWLSNRPDES
jgi:diguanylate cyclase (GGDEF)-like protein/PAS domain S-box-containing protein